MPDGVDTLRSRVAELETLVSELLAGRDSAAEREAGPGGGRNPRPAITCKKDAGTPYPAKADTPNTYYVKFLDSTYTQSEGDQTPTDTERQSEGRFLAHIREAETYRYLPEGSVVGVFYDKGGSSGGRWWIICDPKTEPDADVIMCLTNGAVVDTDPTITVYNVTAMLPRGCTTPTVTSLPNTFSWNANNNATIVAVYDQVSGDYIPVQVECP